MAKFQGTIQEFHRFIGPRIRNAVNSMTRRARTERNGICEQCGKNASLDSAHVHGRGRIEIISDVLSAYSEGNTVIIEDLLEVEVKILEAHRPIEQTFKFLCRLCHREYDNLNSLNENILEEIEPSNQAFVIIGGVELKLRRTGNRTKQYFFDVLPRLISVAEDQAINLQSESFCKEMLSMAYPVLTIDSDCIFDNTGRRRYYPQHILNKFYICNDWYEIQLSKWEMYLKELSLRD